MIDEKFTSEIQKLKGRLPIIFQYLVPLSIDKKYVIRTDEFSYYNSAKTVCKDFHRPISKIHDDEGKI